MRLWVTFLVTLEAFFCHTVLFIVGLIVSALVLITTILRKFRSLVSGLGHYC